MRRRRPFATTPSLHGAAFASGRTVRAGGGASLGELANSACGDFLAQRWSFPKTKAGGTFNLFYKPSAPARYLWLTAPITLTGSSGFADPVRFDLTITDGTNTATGAAPIPAGWRGDFDWYPGSTARGWGGAGIAEAFVDLDDVAGTLDRTLPWRVELVTTIPVTQASQVEAVTAQEVPRWWVDDAEDFGVLPGVILPRAAIEDTTQTERVTATLETAFANPRTYLHISRDEAAGPYLAITANAAASIPGWEESAGTSITHAFRVQRLRAAATAGARWTAKVRYRVTGGGTPGDKGFLIVTTGTGSYTLSLPDTSGAWTDSATLTGYARTDTADQCDTLTLTGYVSRSGLTVDIDALSVWANPL